MVRSFSKRMCEGFGVAFDVLSRLTLFVKNFQFIDFGFFHVLQE